MEKYLFRDIVIGNEGLLKGPFGSDLKKSLYVNKNKNTYKVYIQENILKQNNDVGTYYITEDYYNKKMSRYAVKENDFIVTCDGTLGEIYQLKNIHEKGIISSSLLRITLNPKIADYDYFYYLFQAQIKNALIMQGNNSVLKHLPGIEVIKNYKIYLPKLDIQKKVSNILKTIDIKIQKNNQINNNLEELMKTIYQRWFIEFEFPNADGKPYKSSGGKFVYNDELKQEIPEGWKVENIMNYINWEGTSQPPKSEFVYEPKGGYIRFIQNRDYDDNSHITYVPKSKVIGICNKYDILMDKYGDAGRTRFGLDGAYNVALAKIIMRNNLYREYIRSFLSSESVYNYLHNSSMASTRASLNENNISFINLTIPPKNLIEKYNKFANNYIESNISLKEENDKLTELKNFLLPLLMNGQINVDDIEI